MTAHFDCVTYGVFDAGFQGWAPASYHVLGSTQMVKLLNVTDGVRTQYDAAGAVVSVRPMEGLPMNGGNQSTIEWAMTVHRALPEGRSVT